MAGKIKGWKKYKGKLKWKSSPPDSQIINIVKQKRDYWLVNKTYVMLKSTRTIGAFHTKKDALKFAKSWMRKHPKG